ncbi:DNA-binding Xre family transcriptional regulator [Sporomusaceae bacterium BoRhaA]|uniref:helix-turn-helix domain-containing protein n=1 Tax=Pelorhabdus rhamnosifermentans TaxID=2772457 RepID=UPI001C0615E6|nr:helix-turn-helix transcriptional regulator [Pelorhabdus rhamnosifermentans]MBU2700423.1 DNA-binding Xre family transcriptional regulator [Pelorhabdus rhamnosifermentans]
MEEFIEIVKAVMEKKNMDITRLALYVGCSTQQMSSLLRKKRRWHIDLMEAVCRVLEIRVSFLFDSQVKKHKKKAS